MLQKSDRLHLAYGSDAAAAVNSVRPVHRGSALFVFRIQPGAVIHQELNAGIPSSKGGAVQGRQPGIVRGIRIAEFQSTG